jgi:hypothetical protein
MKTRKPKGSDGRRGAVLIVVMGLALLGSLAVSSAAFSVDSRVRQTRRQVALEQAFYLAEAGAERAASYIAAGNSASMPSSGSLAQGSYQVEVGSQSLGGGAVQFDITSVGTVDSVSRTVALRGIRRVSWARFALWYDAPLQTMASVDFDILRTDAAVVLEGPTTIALNNTTMTVTNSRKGWTNKALAVPSGGLVYVQTVTETKTSTTYDWQGKPATTTTTTIYDGDLTVSAPNGLGDRLTLVADRNINIAGHILYKNDPQTATDSTDALGLIAKQDVAVATTAPNNLKIFAHIIAQDGGFGVANYDVGQSRGTLTVYGGIVNKMRKAVGIVGGAGYEKNYIFDERFTDTPPPHYPELENELEWSVWEG